MTDRRKPARKSKMRGGDSRSNDDNTPGEPATGAAEAGREIVPSEIADSSTRAGEHVPTRAAPSHGYPISDNEVERLKSDAGHAPAHPDVHGHPDSSATRKRR